MDLNLTLPQGLLKKIIDKVTGKLFGEAYRLSHEYYLYQNRRGAHWTSLGEYLEYDTELATIYSNNIPPTSFIEIKAKKEIVLKNILIKVETYGIGGKLNNTIEIDELDDSTISEALPGIPLKSIWVRGDRIIMPYECVRIRLLRLEDENGKDLIGNRTIEDRFSPSYTEILNSEFIERWDTYWNVDEINWQKQKFKDKMCMKILMRNGKTFRLPERLNMRSFVFWLLTNKFSLFVYFWSRNLLKAKQIKSAIQRQITRNQELKNAA